jgi:hypothetical protein
MHTINLRDIIFHNEINLKPHMPGIPFGIEGRGIVTWPNIRVSKPSRPPGP